MSEPVDPRRLRASDTDRDKAAELLREAAGEGRITLEEVDERLEGVYQARTYAELEVFTADLPTAGSARPEPATRSSHSNRVGGTAGSKASVAIMGGASRKGKWVVPSSYTAVAMMGGVDLDLREATLAEREVVIRAVAIMGGIEIIVPEDVDVIVDGAGIMGGFDDGTGSDSRFDGRPVVRVTGIAFWGGVEVKRKGPKGSKGSKRPGANELEA